MPIVASRTEILIHNTAYDCSGAVDYHYGRFPPETLDLARLLGPLSDALVSLTRYDTLLSGLQNSSLLLAPLRVRDAVVSSRMEGTISTIEEVLRIEAEAELGGLGPDQRSAGAEVALYARALLQAEGQIHAGYGLSEHLIKQAHQTLLSSGRGSTKTPGQYKIEQNYVGDRRARKIEFIPASPEGLSSGMAALVDYIRQGDSHPLIKTAIAHAEFEALHPFDDGNGRVGRMLVPLMLWTQGLLGAPHFFVSDYFETHKPEYIQRLREVSSNDAWDDWIAFFLRALQTQAEYNISIVSQIQEHYERMHPVFRDTLRSRWSADALNYLFANPIYKNSKFKKDAGIPGQTANHFTNRLLEAGIVETVVPPAGRASGLYAFPSLLDIVADR